MAIIKKLDMLMLSKEERAKTEEKFLATLALVSEDELRDVLDFLNSKSTQITKAREIKVVANSKEEIAKKYNILNEIHETDIYRQDPEKINHNVIDIYKKIQYCKQSGIPYKKEDGTYESYLFDESLWQQVASRDAVVVTPQDFIKVEDDIVTFESVVKEPVVEAPVMEDSVPIEDEKFMDIKDYMAANNDMGELEAQTTNFATIRKELEGQLAELDALKNDINFDEISFNDIEPESYGMGR